MIMPMVRAWRLLNAIEDGAITGAELDILLADLGRKSDFEVLLELPGQSQRMIATSLTRSIIANSALARGMIFNSAHARKIWTQSRFAMDALVNIPAVAAEILALPDMFDAVLSSEAAIESIANSATVMSSWFGATQWDNKLLLYNNSRAFPSFAQNPTMRTALDAYCEDANTGPVQLDQWGTHTTRKCVVLQWAMSNYSAEDQSFTFVDGSGLNEMIVVGWFEILQPVYYQGQGFKTKRTLGGTSSYVRLSRLIHVEP
jgi:hypothetical protein